MLSCKAFVPAVQRNVYGFTGIPWKQTDTHMHNPPPPQTDTHSCVDWVFAHPLQIPMLKHNSQCVGTWRRRVFGC